MKGNKEFSDLFDEDFEVTYEDDDTINFEDTAAIRQGQISPAVDRSQNRRNARRDDYGDGAVYADDDFQDEEDIPGERYDAPKRRKSRGVPLAAPIRKGGRTLSRLVSALVRCLTTVLILVIGVYVTYTFWRASTPYGDIMETLRTGQFSVTLAVYLCVAALFLIYEFISMLWSMTRVRVRDASGTWKEDTGRGLFSFIFVFATSYLAFIFSPFIPEAPEAFYGLGGALEVYGSMHNVLFGLCAAGVISCIVRKYFG